MKKILIAVPCMDMVNARFAQSLATVGKVDNCVVSFLIGSLIYESRNNLAKQALTMDADYIMWFDSDMSFPADTIYKMVKHMEEGKDIVSGLYFRRVSPFSPVLFKEQKDWNNLEKWEDYNDYPKDSVFEIGACGFGCVMTKTDVFRELILNDEKWFEPFGGMGEDIAFSVRAQRIGKKIYCDSTIKCGHTGYLTVTEDLFQANSGANN